MIKETPMKLALLTLIATLLAAPAVAQPYPSIPGEVQLRDRENARAMHRERIWYQWRRDRIAYCSAFPRYCREHFDLWYDRNYGRGRDWRDDRY